MTENRRQKTEDRRQKTEDRRQKTIRGRSFGMRSVCHLSSVLCRLVPKFPCHISQTKGELRLISNIIEVCVHCVEKRPTLARRSAKRSARPCARHSGRRSSNPFRPGTAISCGNWKGRRRRATRGVQDPLDGADRGLDQGHVSAVSSGSSQQRSTLRDWDAGRVATYRRRNFAVVP